MGRRRCLIYIQLKLVELALQVPLHFAFQFGHIVPIRHFVPIAFVDMATCHVDVFQA
jgi:hypothetical protein